MKNTLSKIALCCLLPRAWLILKDPAGRESRRRAHLEGSEETENLLDFAELESGEGLVQWGTGPSGLPPPTRRPEKKICH